MTQSDLTASLASYDINQLMAQTRKLAADYRLQTGQALPVTEELARFDAINILGLCKWDKDDGFDATDMLDTNTADEPKSKNRSTDHYLIKGRVIFKGGKARQKLGKLSLKAKWTNLLMVIYNADYLPTRIYTIKRSVIDNEMADLAQDKRGSMTVAKYKAIGDLVWENPDLDTPNLQNSTANKQSKTENGQVKIENN